MKKFMILVCFFSIAIFSCKPILNTDGSSELTTLSMSESGIKKLNTDLSKRNIKDTINYIKLQITSNVTNCTQVKGKKIKSTNGIFQDQTDITLQAGSCTYTLDIEYGTDDTPYYSGETTIGEGKDNPFGSNGTTTVDIQLSFSQDGNQKITIAAGELASGSTNSSVAGSSTAKRRDLINPACKFINDVPLYNSAHSIIGMAILVRKNNASDCINTDWFTAHDFKDDTQDTDDKVLVSGDGRFRIFPMTDRLTNNTEYSLVEILLDSDKRGVFKKSSAELNSNEKYILIYTHDFTFQSNQQIYYFDPNEYTKVVEFVKNKK